jgi:hypothetical protein
MNEYYNLAHRERNKMSTPDIQQFVPETPKHLTVTAELVNAYFQRFITIISLNDRDKTGVPELLAYLQKTQYDGVRTTATDIKKTLQSLIIGSERFTGIDEIRDFIQDLDVISLLETGSYHAVNVKLTQLLQEAKAANTKEEQTEIIEKLNRLVFRSLNLFPHMVNSLALTVLPQKLPHYGHDIYGDDFSNGRVAFKHLQTAYQENYNTPLPETLIVPLPYNFTATADHGSSVRSSVDSSREEMGFTYVINHETGKRELGVSVAIEHPYGPYRAVTFLLDEVPEISFTTATANVPYTYDDRTPFTVKERIDPLHTYLWFRDFSMASGILEAKYTRNLSSRDSRNQTYDGFIIINDDDPDAVKMLEFHNFPDSGNDAHEAHMKLVQKYRENDPDTLSNVTVHQGSQAIIDRLAKIPVEPRSF